VSTSRTHMMAAAQLAAAFAMFPTLTPPEPVRRLSRERSPYYRADRDTVLMDWDLPKSKRAKRRARGRAIAG
jgi:hypothetical protein